jgi:hypothetical protein
MEKLSTFLEYCSIEECLALGILLGMVSQETHCIIMNYIPRLLGLY